MFLDYYRRMKDEPKYVILGCQGSGTNLVSRLLQATLGFSVVHDRALIFNAAVSIAENPTQAEIQSQYSKFRRRVFPGKVRRRFMLKRHYRQAQHFSGLPEVPDSQISSASDFADYLYAYHAYSTNAKCQALKSDDIWESLSHIDTVIPRRRYLLLVRDPRDNAISITNKDFGPRNLYAACQYVNQIMRVHQEEVDRQNQADVITIRYEDLLNNPVGQMEAVSQKWGFEPCEDYLSRIDAMNIRSSNQQKWRTLSPGEVRVCDSVLRAMITRYGYVLAGHEAVDITDGQRAYWWIDDLVHRVPQRAYKTCRNLLFP